MKLYRLISVILACALALSLCACTNSGRGNDLPDDDTVELGDTTDTPDTADTSTTGFKILTDPAIPSEEDIMRVFEHASSIWNQIDIESLDAIGGSEGIILDVTDSSSEVTYPMQYYPVRDYETKADLEARFRECFSKKLTEHKLEHMFEFQYREIDGRLYVSPGSRGTDAEADVSHVEYEAVNNTTVKVTRFINVKRLAITEDYAEMFYLDGVYAQEMWLIYEDGRWVFDNFYVWDNVWGDGYVIIYDYAPDLAAAFLKAEELAAHFTGHASAYVGDNDSFEVTDENGFTQKYEHYSLANSLSELRSLLEQVFTPKLADKFMNTKVSGLPLFTERDGKLYKFGGYVGLYSYDDVHHEIIGYTEGVGEIDITVHLRKNFDGDTVYANQTYTAVLGEDGKYRFDGDFTLPIQIASNMAADTPDTDDTVETGTLDATDTQKPAESAFELLTDPAIPSEENIMRALAHAQRIWSSFGTLPAIYDEENAIQHDGYTYFPVLDYETKADLEARFRESLSKEATERKLESMFELLYREFDGRLYVIPADRGSDIRSGMESIEYEIIDDTTIKVTRLIEVNDTARIDGGTAVWYLAGVNPQEMMLIYEDGRWVFDNFFDVDDLSAYDNGEAIYYDFALDFTTAFLKAEELAAHFTCNAQAFLYEETGGIKDENDINEWYWSYGLATSLDGLRDLLLDVFTEEVADKFMSTEVSGIPLFIERDGKLCKYSPLGGYLYDAVYRHITGYTDNGDGTVSITVSISGTLADKKISADKTYTAVRGEDGKYRFDGDFTLPIQIAVNMVSNG